MACHMEKALLLLKMATNFKLNGSTELINAYFDFFLLYPPIFIIIFTKLI